MTIAICSSEFGLSLRHLFVVYMMLPCASLTACHDKFQTLMTDAIYSCSRPW